MTGEVRVAICGLQVNRKLDGLVTLFYETEIRIPVLKGLGVRSLIC